ncbi:MAG: hypothetical protein ACREFN_07175 [Acetobacteraceae bacterium]
MLPIPTAFAWLLLESICDGAPLAQLANIAAIGAAQAGENETQAFEKFRKYLRNQKHVRAPHEGTQAEFQAAVWRAVRQKLREAFGEDIAGAKRLYRHLRNAPGPFSALVADHAVAAPTAAQQALLTFSERLDRMGAAFASACERGDFEGAKAILLTAEGIDESYWLLPEGSLPDAVANRESLRGANHWDQLKRACVPFALNTTLSWLTLLEIATLSAGRYAGADFSLFQQLITQPRKGNNLGPTPEADRKTLPVTNLIRMVKAISEDINARLRKRTRPSEPRRVNKGDSTKRANDLKAYKKQALLSSTRFISLVNKLSPDAEPYMGEGCGFDITSLHLATNLFSLLTPRDGSPPSRKTQRNAPDQVTCLPAIEPAYMRWWNIHRKELTEGVNTPPRPSWLTALRAETGHPGRRR